MNIDAEVPHVRHFGNQNEMRRELRIEMQWRISCPAAAMLHKNEILPASADGRCAISGSDSPGMIEMYSAKLSVILGTL